MEKILTYLQKNIDNSVQLHKWDAKNKLSLHLAGNFEYYLIQLLGTSFLLIRPFNQQTVQKLQIQMSMIEEQTHMSVALLLEKMSAYRIKKMLQDRMPFIAIDQQMYLPFMAVHIKKQRNYIDISIHEKFTPRTQLIFLYVLYSKKEEFNLEELAEKLNISSMTAVRAMNELEKIGLVDCEITGKTGRKKVFKRIGRYEYYEKGRPYLQNPVRDILYVSEIPDKLKVYKSGLTALGEQTMLAEPGQVVYAVESKAEALLKEKKVSKEIALEELLPKVQIVKYDIGLLSKTDYIDPVSLILGLDEKDERIELAIGELMEDAKWFVE